MDENKILFRFDKESDKAYHAWEVWRDLGPNRTMEKLRRSLELKTTKHLVGWRKDYEWDKRIRVLEKIELETQIGARKKAIESRERSHLLELQSYQKLLSLAKLAFHKKLSVTDENGNLKYDTEELEAMTVAELFELVQDSSKYMIQLITAERNIYGLAGEVVENRFGKDKEDMERIGNLVVNDEGIRKQFDELLSSIGDKQNLDNIRD